MLTPQEVSTHAFSKAMMGGYNMAMVDEFLDEVTDDYTALYKENAALKAKMKVLVEKLEDYRATEDSMRAALLAAQKMADTIVHEAESKRDQLMTQAEIDARLKINCIKQELEMEQARLLQGKQELAQFISVSRTACEKEIELLNRLATLELTQEVEEAPQEPATVAEIEENVMAAFEAEESIAKAQKEPEETDEESEDEDDYPEGNPFAIAEDLEATRQINLNELKFGRNYGKDD